MVEFKNLAWRDVTFVLCARKVPLDEFNILKHKEFELDAQIRGSISIIGQSHVVQLSKGADTLTEILLCVPHNLAAYGPICQTTSLSNFRLGIETGRLKYTIRVCTKFGVALDEWQALSDSFSQKPNSLVFHFPRGHLQAAPLTSVEWQVSNVALTVKSFHTFPDEQVLVETHSGINWT
jgi:hypothetical protein